MRRHGWFYWISPLKGYQYIGPCRCGFGPHAYYLTPSGRIVHAWQLYHWKRSPEWTAEELKVELEMLKKEKAELEQRIQELEKQIQENKLEE